ncbi:putative leucine-rich repeat-containing protein DDB_G0290503 [Euwallacea similis]|uniref:putative leucine-rich repeat-containing protein DDB_G0290503 n=1 Tax=Euwallacea similis TaxID=1736056 RepID=UPI00344F6056
MGNPQSRPDERLRYISRDVNSMRSSLRISKPSMTKARKEHLVETLALHSSEVSSMHGKVKRKDLDAALKNISETMQDVLKVEVSELDSAAVESNSFINVPLSKKRSNSLGSLRSKKTSTSPPVRSSVPTLRDIEAKVEELKTSVNTAMANKDGTQLRVFKKTLTVLAADLELINAEKGTPFERRKESVDKKVVVLFQKVSRALNGLKKDGELQNQSKQSKKRAAMNELADVELKLAENESLLDRMVKQHDSADFATIRNNIIENNQRLAKVDIVDNDVKQRVVLLSQKLTEAVRNLDKIMAKREFESKFSKSLHNYERFMRNFDPKTNADSTVTNLQQLRNSLEHLEEINHDTKTRKKELLNNINNNINQISEILPVDDQKIVEDIVEDNVILRKKVKSMDKEHTVVDQFISYWNNVKTNFNVNAYSHLSLLRIDSTLEEMQESINEIREKIARKCDLNMPTNLVRKRSQSIPKLNNSRNSYGSTNSVDKLIKAKAKVYNLPTPQVQNAKSENRLNRRFSKIEEIKMQVHYIKEKVDDNVDNKKLLKEKLEQYRRNLQEYTKDSNQAVSNNAALVHNEIIELLHKLVLDEFKDKADPLSKGVQKFIGTKYDKEFDDLKNRLLTVQAELETFTISPTYEKLLQDKAELLEQIRNSLEALQERSNYRSREDETAKQFKGKLQQLGEQVKRFSGTYKGVLYNQIERDLNKLLLDVGEKVEDYSSAEMVKEAERLLKILEQRSAMAQSFRGNKFPEAQSDEQLNMTKIKRDLVNIKREIDRTPENNVDAFVGFQSRLDLVNFELSQIPARSNENLAKEKEICSNEAQTLKNVVDAKVALGQQPVVQWPEAQLSAEPINYPKTDVNKEIERFENSFSNIKQKISTTSYEEGGVKFAGMSSEIGELMEKLQNYSFIRGTELHQRQAALLQEMQYYSDALDKEATDIRYVQSIEMRTKSLGQFLEGEGSLSRSRRELESLEKELEEHHFSSDNQLLRNRKSNVQKNINSLKIQLKQLETCISKEIEDIEAQIKVLKPQIETFTGLKTESRYYELNESVTKTVITLDRLEIENEQLKKRSVKLLKELHSLAKALEERALQTQEIVNLEQAIEDVASAKDEEGKSKIQEIDKKLGTLNVVNELLPRKTACKLKLNLIFNKIISLPSADGSSGYSSSSQVSSTPSPCYSTYVGRIANFANSIPDQDQLTSLTEKIEDLSNKIETTNDIAGLKHLDEVVQSCELQLSKLGYTRDSPYYIKYRELTQKVEDFADKIEEKMQDHDRLSGINEEVNEITRKMNTPLTHEQINELDERLNQLLVGLKKIGNPGLKSEVDGCIMRVILCSNRVSEFLKSVQSTRV